VRQVIQGTTTFTLADGLGARGGGKAAHAARAQGKRRKRHGVRALWVDAHGNFKTRGHHASAIARGTVWVTQEVTGGRTRVSVKRGAVAVRDVVTHRTIVVRAGHSYTARARRAVAHRAPAFTGRA